MARANPSIVAVIIAGGRATRMGGTTKALLEVDGAPILEHQRAALRGVVDDVMISANDTAAFAAAGVPVVTDQVIGAGPLAGIAAAMFHGAATGGLDPWWMPASVGAAWLGLNASICVLLSLGLAGAEKLEEEEARR